MGCTSGRDRTALIEHLLEEAHEFDFFQAVRVLQRWAADQAASNRPGPHLPIGADHAPRHEAVRLRAQVSHAFPAGTVAEIRRVPEGPSAETPDTRPIELVATCLGLVGPHGVLPEHYTTLVIERLRGKDTTLRDFLDLFHHRTLSLFYRAWEKYRFPIGYEKSLTPGLDEDLFTHCLYCLVGFGTGGLRRRSNYDDEALLYYAGLLAQSPPAAVSLEVVVADYFAVPAAIRQFHGQWLYLSLEDQSRLPGSQPRAGQNNQLGGNVVIGDRVWDVQSKFRVRLGPLDYVSFRRFVPNGESLSTLGQLVRTYAGPQWDFDVQLVLFAADVPWCRLGGDEQDPSRLGWNTWIRNRPLKRDAADAVFVPKEP
jgi:type VI secretion system protein ImpH